MEEKQMNEKKEPELKGKMGIVWLTGILVILLGCVTVYTLKLCNENKELKQEQQYTQQQIIKANQEAQKEEPAKVDNTTVEEKRETAKSTETEKTIYTFSSLEGVYKGKDIIKGDDNKEYKIDTELYLFSNGMYRLEELGDAASGDVGNYIIDGDKIILTAWLSHGSDAGYTFYNSNKNTKKYEIKNKDLINNLKRTSKKVNNDILKNLSGVAQAKEKLIY